MITRRRTPEPGSTSSRMVFPSTMSSKRTTPSRSARIGTLYGSQVQRVFFSLTASLSFAFSTRAERHGEAVDLAVLGVHEDQLAVSV